jgi:hypothetical protein
MGWPTRRERQREVKKQKGPLLWNQLTRAIRSDITEYLSVFPRTGVTISTDPKDEDLARQELNVFVADSSAAPSPPRTKNIVFAFDPEKATITANVATKPQNQEKQYTWKIVADQEGDDLCLIELGDGLVAPQWISKAAFPEPRITPEWISEEVLSSWLP